MAPLAATRVAAPSSPERTPSVRPGATPVDTRGDAVGSVRVLTVDDHATFREAARALVAATDRLRDRRRGDDRRGGRRGGVPAAAGRRAARRATPRHRRIRGRPPDRAPPSRRRDLPGLDRRGGAAGRLRPSAVAPSAFVRKQDLRPSLLRGALGHAREPESPADDDDRGADERPGTWSGSRAARSSWAPRTFYPEERPVHEVAVDGFWIDEHQVTVAEFRRFVKATGYVTMAERPLDPADYPDADPALLVPGLAGLPSDPRPGPARQLPQLVVLRPRRQLAPPGGPRQHARRPRSPPGHPRGHGTTSPRTQPGPARSSRPRPSGSTRRAAASRARSTPGATSSRRAAG